MSEKSTKIVSISMEPSLLDKLDATVRAEKGNRSAFVCELIKCHLDKNRTVVTHDSESIPIVLKVPGVLKGDRKGLQDWLTVKLNAITNALS